MAIATLQCLKCTSTAAGTETDSSKNPCFLNADIHSTDTSTYPVAAPLTTGTTSWSYEVWLRWKVTAAPDNYIQNFKFYGPTSQPDTLIILYDGTSQTATTPVQTNSTFATGDQADLHNAVGNALTVPINESGNQLDAINEKTDWLVLQYEVQFGAPQGSIATQLFHVTYEEV